MSNSLESAFKGRKVLVTGAGRGIGKAVTKRLHSYGAQIYAVSRNPKNLEDLKRECPGIKTIACDIGNWDETRNALKDLEAVDYLLNNAAVNDTNSTLGITPAQFENTFNINVKGTMNVTQIVAQKMVENGKGGSIAFVSSVGGLKVFPASGLYCMSKAAIDMLAKAMALELGPHKIRVNIIRPAAVDTDMLKQGIDALSEASGLDAAGVAAGFEARAPYPGFTMEMDHLVNLILFTLSDMCPQMTGADTTMDGGLLIS